MTQKSFFATLLLIIQAVTINSSFIDVATNIEAGTNFTAVPLTFIGSQSFDLATVQVISLSEELCDDIAPIPQQIIDLDDTYPFAILSLKKLSVSCAPERQGKFKIQCQSSASYSIS